MIEEAIHLHCDRCGKNNFLAKKAYVNAAMGIKNSLDSSYAATYFINGYVRYNGDDNKILCPECNKEYEKILKMEEEFWE